MHRPRGKWSRLGMGAVAIAACVTAVPATASAAPGHTSALASGHTSLVQDPTAYVDPMIGTKKGVDAENTFPGVTAPFGMMQFSPDTTSGATGYEYTSDTIKGFSLDHFSGGCSSFGDIPILPVTGAVGDDPAARTEHFSHDDEHASTGAYSVKLKDSGVQADIGASTRTGIANFQYPKGSRAQVLVKSGTSLGGDLAARVQVVNDHELRGTTTPHGLCNNSQYTMYFDITFNRPFTAHGTWGGGRVTAGADSAQGAGSGAYLTFDTSRTASVAAKVGMSYVSTGGAAKNMAAEIPGWNVRQVQERTRADWRGVLGKVRVGGGTKDQLTTFYTSLYRSFQSPSVFNDVDRRYIGFDDKIHTVAPGHTQYATFSDWDIYRSLAPLQTMIYPRKAGDMANSLLRDAQQQGGWWPKWPSQNMTGNVMNGDNGVPLFAQYVAFGAKGVDIKDALPIMEKGATTSQKVGWGWTERPGVEDYVRLGYAPNDAVSQGDHGLQGASETLEWATDDFTISQLAAKAGDRGTAAEYARRGQNWQNIFDPATGYLRPRDDNGSFPAGPGFRTPPAGAFGQDGYDEGNAAQYNWSVQQDIAGLVAAMGGKDKVIPRLDTFFSQLNAGGNAPYDWAGNEIDTTAPWMYDYVGQPWKTQEVTRRFETELFTTEPDGLPGNDDNGALSSEYVWAALGMMPATPGTPTLALNSPLFRAADISLGTGHHIVIDAPKAATDAPYVTRMTLNGRSYESTALPASFATRGGDLGVALSTRPDTHRATSAADAPPSYRAYEGPAIGYLTPTGTQVAPGGTSLAATIGVSTLAGGAGRVGWSAHSDVAGVSVTPSSGTLDLRHAATAKTPVTIKVGQDTPSGYHPVTITFRTARGQALPGGAAVITVPAADGAATACDTLGSTDTECGLKLRDNGDGHTTPVTVGGRPGRSTTDGSPFEYFDIDNTTVPGGTYRATVTVDYYDHGTGSWTLQYDAVGNAYKSTAPVAKTGTDTWKTATFTVDDAAFAGGENAGTDFRLANSGDTGTIGRVHTSVTGDGVLALHLCPDDN
ncbi:GH92 family glycosyl hydrolase [Streptomyces sp. 8L]|uniref:GH92 family glycosyl hydrolase n=1 Tax=Streptomyces sp. 8L TaxID=2877242 RepID=UPI001CD54769|nr:GH92 family glycosyl hydrolase [Streptomyces sp. 8L]MCA1223185.1 GH92 family glycosyl hydrolase [Streptomyces sp. 8L]